MCASIAETLTTRAKELVDREARLANRRVGNVSITCSIEWLALHLEIDRSPTLIHLRIKPADALEDLERFDGEVESIARLLLGVSRRGLTP